MYIKPPGMSAKEEAERSSNSAVVASGGGAASEHQQAELSGQRHFRPKEKGERGQGVRVGGYITFASRFVW
jgi:hypothetical protein